MLRWGLPIALWKQEAGKGAAAVARDRKDGGVQKPGSKAQCVWDWGVARKPHCVTLGGSLELETAEMGRRTRPAGHISPPFPLGSLSKAPQREREKTGGEGSLPLGPMRLGRWSQRLDQACSLLAIGVERTGPRSLRVRSKG